LTSIDNPEGLLKPIKIIDIKKLLIFVRAKYFEGNYER